MALTSKQLSEKYDLNEDTVKKAFKNLSEERVVFFAISGKIGAGKDTVPPNLLKALNIRSNDCDHEFFAKPLKSEVTQLINICRYSGAFEEAVERTSLEMNVKYERAKEAVTFIYRDVKQGEVTSGYDRTPSVRLALQHWGTEVRREQDDLYWVKLTIKSSFESLAEGRSVYITDTRFPNENDSVVDSNGITIRLLVSTEEQTRRIKMRDGIEVTEASRNHISETALDNYSNFDIIVDTDKNSIENVVKIIKESDIWQKN